MGQALGLVTRDEAGGMPEGIKPPARREAMSVHDALSLDAVYRAFTVLETATMQLTLDVWRGRTPVEPQPAIVRNPDVLTDNQSAFLAQTVTSLAARGNAYWRKHRSSASGEILRLEVLDPREVAVIKDPDTRRVAYSVAGRTVSAADLSHLSLLRLPGEVQGLGPIQAARRRLGGAIAQAEYADEWFDSGGVPNGVLSTDQKLTTEQAKEYKQQWMKSQSHKEGVAVLGGGLDYKALMLKPADVQWLEAQKFSVTSVARLFGMPSSYLLASVEGQNLTYQNQEQEDLGFVRFTLMRYLREIEQAFTALLPRGQVARFNVDALLRTDTKTRYEAHKIGLDAGFLTIEEVRHIERLDPNVTPAPRPQEAPTNA